MPDLLGRICPEEAQGGEDELKREIKHNCSPSHDGIGPLEGRRRTWTHHGPLGVTLCAGFWHVAVGSEFYSLRLHHARLPFDRGHQRPVLPRLYHPGRVSGRLARFRTHALLSRSVFGVVGSWLVSAPVPVTPPGWVGSQADPRPAIWDALYGWGAATTMGS